MNRASDLHDDMAIIPAVSHPPRVGGKARRISDGEVDGPRPQEWNQDEEDRGHPGDVLTVAPPSRTDVSKSALP